jgi:ABC-type sugar transport system substrate-binding protein
MHFLIRALSATNCSVLALACLLLASGPATAADDALSAAKDAVKRYAGPQTTWQGPTSAPTPAKNKFIVYLSGDEQNDISREYGLYMKEAAGKLGWKLTVIDGKGSPVSWVAGFNQAIALKPDGIAIFADAKSLQDPIRTATDQVKLIGADGNRSAYERIRQGNAYQTVTVSEPIELQAYQAVDEFNRAFNKASPSGFVQPPYLVTPTNVNEAGGTKDIFVPDNDYKKHYLQIWGVA